MLDAIDTLPKEDAPVAPKKRAVGGPSASGFSAIGAWGAMPWGTTPFGLGAPVSLESQRVMAASMMMAPFAMAQSSSLAMRKANALGKHWRDSAARCRTMQELIDVNRAYGERAIALGAGEMWRFIERSTLLGRAAASASPGGMAVPPASPEVAEAEPLAKAS